MRLRGYLFLALSLLLLAAAGVLATNDFQDYQQLISKYPPGSSIGGVPVGGLDQQAAGLRVAQVYMLPVELHYAGSILHLDPVEAGQQLDLSTMIQQAEQARASFSGMQGFWSYLWNQRPQPFSIPLLCSTDNTTLTSYLPGLFSGRYDRQPTHAYAVAGDASFIPGHSGEAPDLPPALPKIAEALCSSSHRTVEVSEITTDPLPPDPEQLPLILEAIVQAHGFDGTMELYYQDLQNGNTFSLAFHQGKSVEPGIAFTAASTIKVPVLVSAYKRLDESVPPEVYKDMQLMIDLSENSSTDQVMMSTLDPNLAPLQVTKDMQELGLKNTFLAGFFYLGAPLLDRIQTEASQRSDVSTDPDIYNQTTASDMGRLLVAIQNCAGGNGPIIETYEGQVTPVECQAMLELLASNRKGVLVEAGVPDGTRVAHKYGWVSDPIDGLMHAASDAAVVYTPGGNFVFTVYLYHPEQLQWEPAQRMVAHLTTAVYNYYNQWR